MSFARLLTVFGKELRDHARDRRSLLSASIGVVFGPLMLAYIVHDAAQDRRSLEQIRVPVVGMERAPGLMSWLEQQAGVSLEDYQDDAEAAVRAGDIQVALEIDEDYVADFTSGRPAQARLLFNDRRSRSRAMAGRVRRLVEAYSANVGRLRLIARGVAPSVPQAVRVEDVEVSAEDTRSRRLLGIVPMMLLLAAFAAGMSASADATAGERERGSLEALLANPVTAAELMAGKWAAAATLAAFGVAASIAFHFLVLGQTPLYELGVRLRLGPQLGLALFAVAFPVALFAPAFEMCLALFARSIKEAQSYLAFAVMLPIVPVMMTSMSDAEAAPWLEMIPIVGQSQSIIHMLIGEAVSLPYAITCAALTLALAAVCVFVLARLLEREAIVFGRS
ncbi:MAG: ABC transporter permease [Acidobacteria bacterium]|nr:ABC transporter permease [Acidobacteriota bacterium]